MTKQAVKISIIQFQPVLGNPDANIRQLEPLITQCADSYLVILPELSNSGYNFRDYDEASRYSEEIGKNGPYQEFLKSMARKGENHIVSGINETDNGRLYNSAILVDKNGVAGKYRKLHLFMNEKDIFQKGDAGLPVFDLGIFKIGIMICFDYLFPEPWRIMAEKGADLICHPSNLLTENAQRCLPGLSLMNRIYIACANRIGAERGLTFNGTSLVTGPSGSVLKKASSDRAEIISAEIDTGLSRNKMVTSRNHAFNDRRPEAYMP